MHGQPHIRFITIIIIIIIIIIIVQFLQGVAGVKFICPANCTEVISGDFEISVKRFEPGKITRLGIFGLIVK